MKILVLLIGLSFSIFAAEKTAVFAGGCFWCMQPPFDKAAGVTKTSVGYIGGSKENADYQKVSSGKTKHIEAIKVWYDSDKTSYKKLLKIFWKQIDPTQTDGQFADRGDQYKTVIYYSNKEEKALAEKSKKYIGSLKIFKGKKIFTPIIEGSAFYPAEEYHQKYYTKNYAHYSRYKKGSGREKYLKDYWSDVKLDF